MKDFHDLHVWERSHKLTLVIYAATMKFPREELYGLTSQIRRCTVSIGANIAEGCGKMGNIEFQRFLQISAGSASELDYELCSPRTWATSPDPTTRESQMSFHRSERC
jgi:four helix bundle protein